MVDGVELRAFPLLRPWAGSEVRALVLVRTQTNGRRREPAGRLRGILLFTGCHGDSAAARGSITVWWRSAITQSRIGSPDKCRAGGRRR